MSDRVTVFVRGVDTIDPMSSFGGRISEISGAIRAKLNGVAIDLLEADNAMGARAVLELNMQINASIRAILGEGMLVEPSNETADD